MRGIHEQNPKYFGGAAEAQWALALAQQAASSEKEAKEQTYLLRDKNEELRDKLEEANTNVAVFKVELRALRQTRYIRELTLSGGGALMAFGVSAALGTGPVKDYGTGIALVGAIFWFGAFFFSSRLFSRLGDSE